MREASLYLLRHPATPYNMGAHGQERSRGHLRIPPDPEKTEEFVRRSAEPLRRAGVVEIETSTLPRAEFAAEALGRELGVPVIPQRALVTGDTGEMAGRLEQETLQERKKYMKYPDTKVPGGEEAQTFLDRWGSQLRRLLRYAEEHPQEPIAAVVHGHQFMALRPILERDDVRERDWDNLEKMPPGTLLRLAIRDGEVKIERVRT